MFGIFNSALHTLLKVPGRTLYSVGLLSHSTALDYTKKTSNFSIFVSILSSVVCNAAFPVLNP